MALTPISTDRYLTEEVRQIPNDPDKRGDAILSMPINEQRWLFRLFDEEITKYQKQHGLLTDQQRVERLDAFAERLSNITKQIDPENADEIERIALELKKASHAMHHGSSKGADIDGNVNRDGPNPNSPQRRLLWAYALKLSIADLESTTAKDGIENLSGKTKEAKLDLLEREIAESRSMQQMKARFAARASSRGGFTENPVVRFGQSGSWFYSANKKTQPNLRRNVINLDILQTLILGDFVDAVFQHELEHDEKSLTYPPFLQDLIDQEKDALDRMKEAQAGIKAIDVSGDIGAQLDQPEVAAYLAAQTDLMRAQYKRQLVHGVWNAAEDNMCNQGAANLSHAKSQPYLFDLAYSINLCTTLIAGCGDYIRKDATISDEAATNPQEKLSDIRHAINMAFFVRNGICEKTPEELKTIGVDTRALTTADEADGQKRFDELYDLCERIAHAQPHPDKRIYKNYAQLCNETCKERNVYIQELYERFVEATVEQCMQQYSETSLEEQIEMLKESIEQRKEAGRGGAPMPQQSMRSGRASPGGKGGQQDIGIPIIDPETGEEVGKINEEDLPENGQAGQQNVENAKAVEAEGIEKGEEIEALKSRAASDKGNADKESDQNAPDEERGNLSDQAPQEATKDLTNAKQGGPASDALAALSLSDGRTLSELQQDPLYEAAVEQIAEKLRVIMEQFPTVTLELERKGSLLKPPAREIKARTDRDKIKRIPRKLANGGLSIDDLRFFRDDKTQKIASPGDLFLSIDASGSMGSGPGSEFAIALKSAALLRDAAEKVNIGVYVSLWGNSIPSLIIHPDMEKEDAHKHLDAALYYILEGNEIKGVHGGTDVGPSIAQMFARLGKERETLSDDALRGPAQALVLSDGGIYGRDAYFDLSESLEDFPYLTYDAGLTMGENSQLHRNLLAQAEHLPEHQQPICFGIDDPNEIPHQLVSWAEERMQQMMKGISEGRAIRQSEFREKSEDALRIFCETHMPNADIMMQEIENDDDVVNIETPDMSVDGFEHAGRLSTAQKHKAGVR